MCRSYNNFEEYTQKIIFTYFSWWVETFQWDTKFILDRNGETGQQYCWDIWTAWSTSHIDAAKLWQSNNKVTRTVQVDFFHELAEMLHSHFVLFWNTGKNQSEVVLKGMKGIKMCPFAYIFAIIVTQDTSWSQQDNKALEAQLGNTHKASESFCFHHVLCMNLSA